MEFKLEALSWSNNKPGSYSALPHINLPQAPGRDRMQQIPRGRWLLMAGSPIAKSELKSYSITSAEESIE